MIYVTQFLYKPNELYIEISLNEIESEWNWLWMKLNLNEIEFRWNWIWMKLNLNKVEFEWNSMWMKFNVNEIQFDNETYDLHTIFQVDKKTKSNLSIQ